jgi:5'-nucleotidase
MHQFESELLLGYKARIGRYAAIVVLAMLSVWLLPGCGSSHEAPVGVKILAVNDFHGYLLPEKQLFMSLPDPDGGADVRVNVGGAAYLASFVQNTRAQSPNTLFVGVGDFVGGSPALSTWTTGEATIEAMNLIGLEVSAVGNHEFDRGKTELKRLQNGGCATGVTTSSAQEFSCARTGIFEGARFPYLAANVIDHDTGKSLFPATFVRRVGSVSIGFIGLTLRDTPQSTRGAQGLTFLDEVSTIREHAARLKQEGVEAVVVLLHEGGSTSTSSLRDQTCADLAGPIKSIVSSLPPTVDVVLSAHTHFDYLCEINGILLSQAGSYGRMATEIDLSIRPGRGVTAKSGKTVPIINDLTATAPKGYSILSPDPQVSRLVEFYDQLTRPLRTRALGFIDSNILRTDIDGTGQVVRSGTRIDVADHPIGRVFADALLAMPAPDGQTADVAFINPGGLRNYLPMMEGGKVDYETLFGVAPFGDALYRVEMTGESLIRLLEQQWEAPNCTGKRYKGICGRVLQPSHSLTYTWTFSPEGQGKASGTGKMIDLDSLRIHGKPLVLDAIYKVVTVEFLAVYGGDYFTAFTNQRLSLQNVAATDMDALQAYLSRFTANSPLPPPTPRIRCVEKVSGKACEIPVL